MGMSGRPKTRYAKSGEVNIAYQVVGEGPRDLVFVPGWVSNIEVFWEEPSVATGTSLPWRQGNSGLGEDR